MSIKTKSRSDKNLELIGYLLAPLIGAWVYVWMNYVWIQWPVSYWQWVALTVALILATKAFKPLNWPLGLLGALTIIAQVAKWVGLVSFPLIHK